MKKHVSLLLAVFMTLSACAMLTACDEEHRHTYGTEWSKDETHHWRDCKGADCNEIFDQAEHVWNDGEITAPATSTTDGVRTFTCTVCAQTKTEPVEYEATADEIWQSAFNNANLTNCTVRLEDPNNGTVVYKAAYVDGERRVYFNGGEEEVYFIWTLENTYIAYRKVGDNWVKQETTQSNSMFEMFSSYVCICPNFGANFTAFEYDATDETYKFIGVEDENEIETNDIMASGMAKYYKASVKLADGRLVQVTANMSGQNGKTDVIYFENYGVTVVELPVVE